MYIYIYIYLCAPKQTRIRLVPLHRLGDPPSGGSRPKVPGGSGPLPAFFSHDLLFGCRVWLVQLCLPCMCM